MNKLHKVIVENSELPSLLEQYTNECLVELERQYSADFDSPRFSWVGKCEKDLDDLFAQALIHHDPSATFDPLNEDEDLRTRVAHLVADVIDTFPEVKRIRVASGSVDTLIIYGENL